MITKEEVIQRLPENINCDYDIYLIGSVIREGQSDKDIDFLTIDKIDKSKNIELTMFLMDALKFRVHIFSGFSLKNNFYLKIYENGKKNIYLNDILIKK